VLHVFGPSVFVSEPIILTADIKGKDQKRDGR